MRSLKDSSAPLWRLLGLRLELAIYQTNQNREFLLVGQDGFEILDISEFKRANKKMSILGCEDAQTWGGLQLDAALRVLDHRRTNSSSERIKHQVVSSQYTSRNLAGWTRCF